MPAAVGKSRHRGGEHKDRQAPREHKSNRHGGAKQPGGVDDDEELRNAIEESKRTAQREEAQRIKEVSVISKKEGKQKPAPEKSGDGDFDFGDGFEKFSTHQQTGKAAGGEVAVGGDNLDFDFGEDVKNKNNSAAVGNEEFNFNFGAEEEKKQDAAAGQSNGGGNVDDLLGLDFNAPVQEASKPAQPEQNIDLFGGAPIAQASTNAPASNNVFGGSSDPFNSDNTLQTQNAPEEQQKEVEKKGFQPDPYALTAPKMQQQQYASAMPGGNNPFVNQFGQAMQQQYFPQAQVNPNFQGGFN